MVQAYSVDILSGELGKVKNYQNGVVGAILFNRLMVTGLIIAAKSYFVDTLI
ncbi:MAG: hypothetical protein SPJ86_06355 [Eubacteriales bacterium]|nr:hypothetical protein [Eubacteriales bacterium]